MKRAIVVGLGVATAVGVTVPALFSYTAKPEPDFGGTWRLVSLELKPMVHRDGHVHAQLAPRVPQMGMTVTQTPESISVRIQVLDSADQTVDDPPLRIYRSQWSASDPESFGAASRTRMKIHRHDGTLELTTIATAGPAGHNEVVTTTESWRIRTDTLLERRVKGVSANETLERIEIWRRTAAQRAMSCQGSTLARPNNRCGRQSGPAGYDS